MPIGALRAQFSTRFSDMSAANAHSIAFECYSGRRGHRVHWTTGFNGLTGCTDWKALMRGREYRVV